MVMLLVIGTEGWSDAGTSKMCALSNRLLPPVRLFENIFGNPVKHDSDVQIRCHQMFQHTLGIQTCQRFRVAVEILY